MQTTLKSVKTWMGREGHAYQATLVVDGVPAVMFTDDASGGIKRWDVINAPAFTAWAATLGVTDALNGSFVKYDSRLELAAAELVDMWDATKRLKRLTKTKTVFTLPGDDLTKARVLNVPFTPAVEALVKSQYPGATILNGTL